MYYQIPYYIIIERTFQFLGYSNRFYVWCLLSTISRLVPVCLCSVNGLSVSMSVDLSCLKLMWLFFPQESPSSQISVNWKTVLSVDQIRNLTSFTKPFHSSFIIESYLLYIWNVSNVKILPIPSLVSHHILLEY